MNGRASRLAGASGLVAMAAVACGGTQPVAMGDQEVFEAIAPGEYVAAVSQVVADPCRQHSWEDPGDSVDDLARALAALPGLEVTASPREVTAFDHQGMYLELTIPQLAHEPDVGFTDCVAGYLYTYRGEGEWGRTVERFHQGPGQILQLWILDVDGVRLLIEANRFPDSPAEDVEELQAILDSIRIES